MSLLDSIVQLQNVLESLKDSASVIERSGDAIVTALKIWQKSARVRNGGSAADALHLCEELVGRYSRERRSLPAICLNADVTALTCIANDYGYDEVFFEADTRARSSQRRTRPVHNKWQKSKHH